MAEMQMYDTETNQPCGKLDIPDDVLAAAAKVYRWMKAHESLVLNGLKLADE